MITRDQVLGKLRTVMDPELGVNIVDLGLIYDIKIEEKKVMVKMTFTTPACPLIDEMLRGVYEKLEEIPDAEISVEVVFEPLWSPEKMSGAAKAKLGIE